MNETTALTCPNVLLPISHPFRHRSTEEKKAHLFLANLGIDYDALTMKQFANLIEVLKLSKHMNSPISQHGKGSIPMEREKGNGNKLYPLLVF